MRSIIVALALASGTAQAGLVYEWQTIRGNDTTEFAGRIEIVGPGAFAHEYAAVCPETRCGEDPFPPVDLSDPTSPVLRFSFGARNNVAQLDLDYTTGGGWVYWSPSRFDLATIGNLLRGSLTVGNGSDYVSMASTGAHWTVAALDSDRGPPCYGSESMFCEGVTGRWVLQRQIAQQQVPLPGTLALLGLGALFGALLLRKQERGVPAP